MLCPDCRNDATINAEDCTASCAALCGWRYTLTIDTLHDIELAFYEAVPHILHHLIFDGVARMNDKGWDKIGLQLTNQGPRFLPVDILIAEAHWAHVSDRNAELEDAA